MNNMIHATTSASPTLRKSNTTYQLFLILSVILLLLTIIVSPVHGNSPSSKSSSSSLSSFLFSSSSSSSPSYKYTYNLKKSHTNYRKSPFLNNNYINNNNNNNNNIHGDDDGSTCSASDFFNFGTLASNFTSCVLNYSNPVRYCEYCSPAHAALVTEYARLNSVCTSSLTITSAMNFAQSIWGTSNCDACVQSDYDTLTTKSNELLHCFKDPDVGPYVCQVCLAAYNNFFNFFISLSDGCQNNVDLFDIYLPTQQLWDTYACDDNKQTTPGIFAIISIVLILPFAFYTAAFLYGKWLKRSKEKKQAKARRT